MTNEEFNQKLAALNENLELAKLCNKAEKRLLDAYKFLLEMEGTTNGN